MDLPGRRFLSQCDPILLWRSTGKIPNALEQCGFQGAGSSSAQSDGLLSPHAICFDDDQLRPGLKVQDPGQSRDLSTEHYEPFFKRLRVKKEVQFTPLKDR